MKTLILSVYDFPYIFHAASCDGGSIEVIDEVDQLKDIYGEDSSWQDYPNTCDAAKKLGYDKLLICDDGSIKLINL